MNADDRAFWCGHFANQCTAIATGADIAGNAALLLRGISHLAETQPLPCLASDAAANIALRIAEVAPILTQVEGMNLNANEITAGLLLARGLVNCLANPGHPWTAEMIDYVAILSCAFEIRARQNRLTESGHQIEQDFRTVISELPPPGVVVH